MFKPTSIIPKFSYGSCEQQKLWKKICCFFATALKVKERIMTMQYKGFKKIKTFKIHVEVTDVKNCSTRKMMI